MSLLPTDLVSPIITAKIKFLAFSLSKQLRKISFIFPALQPGKEDFQNYRDSPRNAHLSSDFYSKSKAF